MQRSTHDKEINKLPPIPVQVAKDIETDDTQVVSINWWEALKQVLPIYIATHISFLFLTYLASLFKLANFSSNALHLHTLLLSWYRWDSGQNTHIAIYGYDAWYRMAFFPLFPSLEHVGAIIVRDPFVAGLIISNTATLAMFMVLYRLVAEDFNADQAWRSVLYMAVFPTAFFFAAAYNESLFLFCTLLSFYFMRKGRWWLAGLAALFASLTRSIAVCLIIPFAYEYMHQRNFQWRKINFSVLSCIGMVGGIIIFSLFGYLRFHDPLAYSHAEKVWHRQLSFPWAIFQEGYVIIRYHSILTFDSIHAVLEISATLFMLVILILLFVGPWKLSKEHWSYAFYAVSIYLFVILVPESGRFPLSSLARYMLEIFPAFIILAAIGRSRNFNIYYLAICLPLLAFMLLQWSTGGWIV